MSAISPITWEDKVNSPELIAFLQQFGNKYYIDAAELNTLRDTINQIIEKQVEIKTATDESIVELEQTINEKQATNDQTFTDIGTELTNIRNTKITYKIKATYALMVADDTPTVPTIYSITNDENKSYERSTYIWKPDGNREWIATTPDN
jgi:hypothetical protein